MHRTYLLSVLFLCTYLMINCNNNMHGIVPCTVNEPKTPEVHLDANIVNKSEELKSILEYLDSPEKVNRQLGIDLARSVLEMDAFDLCQHIRKNHLSLGGSEFCQVLELYDLLANGWYLRDMSIEYEDRQMSFHQFTPTQLVPKLKIRLDKFRYSVLSTMEINITGDLADAATHAFKGSWAGGIYEHVLLNWDD